MELRATRKRVSRLMGIERATTMPCITAHVSLEMGRAGPALRSPRAVMIQTIAEIATIAAIAERRCPANGRASPDRDLYARREDLRRCSDPSVTDACP